MIVYEAMCFTFLTFWSSDKEIFVKTFIVTHTHTHTHTYMRLLLAYFLYIQSVIEFYKILKCLSNT
jgi:hypothetical protein